MRYAMSSTWWPERFTVSDDAGRARFESGQTCWPWRARSHEQATKLSGGETDEGTRLSPLTAPHSHCDGPAGQEHHADGHRYPTDGTARRDAKHEPHMQMEAHHYCRQVKSPVLGHGPSSVSRSEK